MISRITTSGKFLRVMSSINANTLKLFRAQEQMSTGRVINRPSDDPTGTSRLLLLNRRVSESERYLSSTEYGRNSVDSAASQLQDASDLYNQARELMIQAMNGSLSDSDRKTLAAQASNIRDQLLGIANAQFDERYLFAGTETGGSPWSVETVGGRPRVTYAGSGAPVEVRVGNGLDVAITAVGSEVFGGGQPLGLTLSGLTGLAVGSTANEGTGWETLDVRHDATDLSNLAAAGIGVAGAAGGANDTFLGEQALVIDSVAGTVRLGDGEPRVLPDPASPEAADFKVTNAQGGELHLDLSGYTGGDFDGTIQASGSISIDGSSYEPIDFSETDLELRHPESGAVVHLDLTGVVRAGSELATFEGAVNVFDLLQGVHDDLMNEDGLSGSEVTDRLQLRLAEMDRGQDQLLSALVGMGSTSSHLTKNAERLEGVQLQLEGLRSNIRDVDYSQAILEMAEAENTLQLVQATGVRMLQTSLLNFLR